MSKHRVEAERADRPGREQAKKSIFQYLRMPVWASVFVIMLALLSFAGVLKYLEEDAQREMAKNSSDRSSLSSVNPFVPAPPPPTPTPQLSKEYIYAGSRLLAVEDANASAVPPAVHRRSRRWVGPSAIRPKQDGIARQRHIRALLCLLPGEVIRPRPAQSKWILTGIGLS